MSIFKNYEDFIDMASLRDGPATLPRNMKTADSLEVFGFVERGLDEKRLAPQNYIDWTRSLFNHNLPDFTDRVRGKILSRLTQFLEHGGIKRNCLFGPASVYLRTAQDMLKLAADLPPHLVDLDDLSETLNVEYIKYEDDPERRSGALNAARDFALGLYDRRDIGLDRLVEFVCDYGRMKVFENKDETTVYLKPVLAVAQAHLAEPYRGSVLSEAAQVHNQKIIAANGGTPVVRLRYGQAEMHRDLIRIGEDSLQSRVTAVSALASYDTESTSFAVSAAAFIRGQWQDGAIDAKKAAVTAARAFGFNSFDHAPLKALTLEALTQISCDTPENPMDLIRYLHEFRHGTQCEIQNLATRMRLDAIETAYRVNPDFRCNFEDYILSPLSELPEDDAKDYAKKFIGLYSERQISLYKLRQFFKYAPDLVAAQAEPALSDAVEHLETDPPHSKWHWETTVGELADFFVLLPAGHSVDLKLKTLELMNAAAASGEMGIGYHVELSRRIIASLPAPSQPFCLRGIFNVLENAVDRKDLSEKDAASIRANLLPSVLKMGGGDEDSLDAMLSMAAAIASDLGESLAEDQGRQSLGRLRDVFRRFKGEVYKTNSTVVWMGANARRDPAIAVFGEEGEPVVSIFNLKGRLSDVRQKVETRYPKGHARHAIFETFVGELGLAS